MQSLPDGFKALVIGASGGIGSMFVACLADDPRCGCVVGLHRRSSVAIDFDRDDSIADAAAALASDGPYHLIVHAAGVLHGPGLMPEKSLAQLDGARMMASFRVNSVGPALVLRHFTPLLDRTRAVVAMLSARVGSIEDNRLGGWYSYRASKAALNMIVKTAAIELRRTMPGTIVVALHPGTVDTKLSRPFRGSASARPARDAVGDMLRVLDGLVVAESGGFVSFSGARVPW